MRQENVAALAGDRPVSDNRGAMPDSPHLSVRVLGPARLTVDGAAAPPELLWRKHLALLVYLARSPRKSRTREHLLGLLWSDRTEALARHSLSEALRVLRRVLGDTAVPADVDQGPLRDDRVPPARLRPLRRGRRGRRMGRGGGARGRGIPRRARAPGREPVRDLARRGAH